MAEKLNLKVGDNVSLSVNTANGDVQEQTFTVRGIYTTNTYGFDSATIFLPLAKAQAMTQTENHASTIFVLLKDTSHTDSVASALRVSEFESLTWKDLNALFVEFETMAQSYIGIFYMIILAITASVIINTLIMSVYERTREIGILSAIGMRGGRIMMLFLAESSLLAVGGVIMGLILGVLGILLFQHQRILYRQHGTERLHGRRYDLRQIDLEQHDQPDHHDLCGHDAGWALPGRDGFPHATGRSPARRKINAANTKRRIKWKS